MQERLLKIATTVVARADRSMAADRVLRAELKTQRGVMPQESRMISRAVFAYFRWVGWLKASDPLPKRVEQAIEMQQAFNDNPQAFPDQDLAQALPPWIFDHMTVTADWVRTLQAEPKLWLRARRGTGPAIMSKIPECHPAGPGPLADILEFRSTRDLSGTTEMQTGAFEIQNISSQLIGHLCDPKSRELWWDVCAGEGGKLLHLADLMRNKGLVWATDRMEWRLKNLRRRAARAQCFNYRVALWDGGSTPPEEFQSTQFDGILLDAQCSNVGTWQRNPHARWTTTSEDVRELAARQIQMLRNVAPFVKPGGKLFYAVCTLTQDETLNIVDAFNQSPMGFEPMLMPDLLDPQAPPSPFHFLWPHVTGGNGMFIAAWRKPGPVESEVPATPPAPAISTAPAPAAAPEPKPA